MENKRGFLATLLVLCVLEIFYFSSIKASGISGSFNPAPIIYHICIFFLLNTFILNLLTKKKLFLGITLSLIFAFLDEAHQIVVPGRSASFSDISLDLFGIVLATLIFLYQERKIKENQKQSLY